MACVNSINKNKFFSEENIKYIQEQIKKNIKEMTNDKIILVEDQDEIDLLTAMYSFFNSMTTYKLNLAELNELFLKNIVKNILFNIEKKYYYENKYMDKRMPFYFNIKVN